jgi:hypothetical protein
MKVRLMALGALLVTGARLNAQSCTTTGNPLAANAAQDACRKAIDLVNFLSPQLAGANAGGNATIGQGGALGGFGHFEFDIRATAVNGSLPKLDNVAFNVGGQSATAFAAKNEYVPAVSANAAIGIWRGVPVGVSHIGGLDALVTATYLQNINGSGNNNIGLTLPGGNTKFGFGARVGLLEESLLAPGISVTYLERDLPTLAVAGTVQGTATQPGGTISIGDYAVKTTAVRATVAKNLSIIGLALGVGQDTYKTSSAIAVTATSTATGTATGAGAAGFNMTRTNYFLDLSLNLYIMKLVGEIGQESGGTTPAALNTFGSDPSKARTYFTLGLRFGR